VSDIYVDLTQLIKLSDDLAAAPARMQAAVTPVVKRGAYNIKKDAFWLIQSMLRRGYASAYPYSISYDVYPEGKAVIAEIGPDKDKPQGALGNLIEFGSANNAPLPHLMPAGELETPKLQANLLRVAAKAVLG
jgi:hypothetical protein